MDRTFTLSRPRGRRSARTTSRWCTTSSRPSCSCRRCGTDDRARQARTLRQCVFATTRHLLILHAFSSPLACTFLARSPLLAYLFVQVRSSSSWFHRRLADFVCLLVVISLLPSSRITYLVHSICFESLVNALSPPPLLLHCRRHLLPTLFHLGVRSCACVCVCVHVCVEYACLCVSISVHRAFYCTNTRRSSSVCVCLVVAVAVGSCGCVFFSSPPSSHCVTLVRTAAGFLASLSSSLVTSSTIYNHHLSRTRLFVQAISLGQNERARKR
mgnify:CR=1 FL=1